MAAGGFLQSTKGGFVSAPAASGGGGSALSLSEEGSELTSAATSINVVGAALTATQSGTAITITQGSWSTGSVIGGATMTLGSDATGDTYYRNAGGVLTRLGVGSNTHVLTLAAGVPSWAAPAGGGVDHDAALTINDSGNDVDFRVESNDREYMLAVDGGTNRVGIGLTTAPAATLDIMTGTTLNDVCILFREDSGNVESIVFREDATDLFALQYDGALTSPNNLFKIRCAAGAAGLTDDAMTVSQAGNIGVGTSTFNASAVKTLAIGNGTAPAAGTDGQCSVYAKDSDACSLLLHMNGSDDGTTFTDSSPHNHTMTVFNQSHLDTTVKKFGTASYQGDGVSDRIETPDNSAFAMGLGDFTIEFWFRPSDLLSYQILVSHYSPEWECRMYTNTLQFLYYGASTLMTHPTLLVADTWYHVAWSRVNLVGNLFINGVGHGTPVAQNTNYTYTTPIAIGSRPGSVYSFNGYIDDVRILKGVGLYVDDFTPPAAELGANTSELYALDELGNETQISPHNMRNEWEFYSKNKNTGRCVKVNMERMIKRLEELHPGEKFLEEWNE